MAFNAKPRWFGDSYRIGYQKGATTITKVFPGLPSPGWSMKWDVLGNKTGQTTATFLYIEESEPGPSLAPGKGNVDKTALVYHMPEGPRAGHRTGAPPSPPLLNLNRPVFFRASCRHLAAPP